MLDGLGGSDSIGSFFICADTAAIVTCGRGRRDVDIPESSCFVAMARENDGSILLDAEFLGVEDGRASMVAEHRDRNERLGHAGE